MPLAPDVVPKMNLRDAYSHALAEVGRVNPKVVVLDADLALSTKTKRFGTLFPDRFFDVGIAELNLMGVAAGLAASGKIAFASTFATFAAGQPYNVIRQSIAYPNLNVKIVATHAGLSVGGDGATHQMLEDLSLMRGLPNFKVFVPADAPQMESIIKAIVEVEGPCYVRCGRDDSPILPEQRPVEVGKAIVLRPGADVTLVGCGTMVWETLKAADKLEAEGFDPRVILVHTIKPLDEETIVKAARETAGIVTAEEHSVYGGLGSAVAETVGEHHPCRVKRIGTTTFGESGDAKALMAKYGLTAKEIAAAAKEIVGKR
ncbi:MAG TPA: transketolase C-terminal domain-containing protein [Candidatus Thermoplasmatota archaeon]|nr:transketolase C-terminal domain-containing protein [Candidatus Thermoplasmatota archaeon]